MRLFLKRVAAVTRSGRPQDQHLIVLTRYPRPGLVKTRLAADLGAQRAADLHRAIAAHCLEHLLPLAASGEASVEVRYDGGTEREMRAWLGRSLRFRQQPKGDLGERLASAFADAFAAGANRVIAVGSDCPDLDAVRVREAFALLDVADAVLTPAEDGGYALVGARRAAAPRALAALFEGVPWGEGTVLRTTLDRAQAAGLSVALTEALADIDRSTDLGTWRRILEEETRVRDAPSISVIIPTLNEAQSVSRAVDSAIAGGAREVIVADGGSRDGTSERARAAGARVVHSVEPGRAVQMNAGAAAAAGDVLLFLHADTRLPPEFARHVRVALAGPGVIAGAFEFGIDGPRGVRDRIIDRAGRALCRMRAFPYGDQALFLRASTFRELGGFPDIPTMEDYELAHRLRRLGRIALVRQIAPTSARSWHEHGLVWATAVNVAVIAGYRLRVPAERLATWRHGIASRGEESLQTSNL